MTKDCWDWEEKRTIYEVQWIGQRDEFNKMYTLAPDAITARQKIFNYLQENKIYTPTITSMVISERTMIL
jgi:hypothetical protein